MKLRVPALLAACCLAGSITVTAKVGAHSLLDFDLWMQKIEKRSLSMQRSLKRKNADAAIADAREIQDLYALMQQYFVERGDSDSAIHLSAQGREFAAKIIESAGTANYDGALASAIALAKDCRDCHDEYKPL